jgi:WD40 repeat protein
MDVLRVSDTRWPGGFGGIYIFDAPNNTVAIRSVKAHDGPISALSFAGGALASGGADGFVHLWAATSETGASASSLEKIHTYSFKTVDAGKDPAVRPTVGTSSNPNTVVRAKPATKPAKPPEPASSTKPPVALPTTGNDGVGAIRSLALLPLGAKRAVANNRRVQIPTLLVGTARCSLWRLEPQGGIEFACGHFGAATGVAPHPTESDSWASCGADQQLLLWRTTERLPRQRMLLAKPANCVAYAADGCLIATGFGDGTLSVLRPAASGRGCRSAPTAAQPTGGSGAVEVLAFAPDSGAHGGMLAVGSHDRMVRVLELVSEGHSGSGASSRLKLVPRCCCSGHTATVTHIDWSADATLLMTNCAAHEILVWSVPSGGKKVAQPARALATATWATWTCTLGFPVMGIWPEGANATLMNSCHLSRDGASLLTADDTGSVKLFNAPCVVEGAPYAEGRGHSAGVACARFLADDRAAVSSGGADRSIMLWRLEAASRGDSAAGALGARTAALPDLARRQCMVSTPWKAID